MRFTQSWLAVGAIVVSMTLPNGSWAMSETEARLNRLENIVENEINMGLLNQLESLQQEIRELRGKLEEQQNALQASNQKQEKLFVNLDARIDTLNSQGQSVTEEQIINLQPATPDNALAPTAAVNSNLATTEPTAIDPVSKDQIAKFSAPSEQSLYDTAYGLMTNKKYAEAITEFKDLIWQFPEGIQASNAYYWIGEMYLLQWYQNRADNSNLEQAKEAFTIVTARYKDSPKSTDALLKLGMIELDLGNWTQAKDLFNQVIQKQPDTSLARIANSKLQSIKQ